MAGQKFKVLVADDSAFARRITISSLANSEFDVVGEAKTDKEAVAKFREHAPDVVLLDVIMPEQGGMYALKEIMQINPQAKVVMLSSLGTEEAITECLTLGATTFLQKPFDKAALVATLKKLLGI